MWEIVKYNLRTSYLKIILEHLEKWFLIKLRF